jgi:hypothetical protein
MNPFYEKQTILLKVSILNFTELDYKLIHLNILNNKLFYLLILKSRYH